MVWNTGIAHDGPLPNCAKGGTRIRPGLTRDEISMLARNMAIKNAAAGLPLGGCKSGLNADPRASDFETQYRRFIALCKPYTYENGGVFGGFGFDIGAAPEHALWACDTLQSTQSFTGKPVAMGGTDYDREGIAGLGVAVSAAELLALNGEDIRTIRFCVHGLGAMGAAVVRYFSELGATLHSIGDPKFDGTWVLTQPPSQPLYSALISQDNAGARRLLDLEGKKVSGDANAVLLASADVLFPCAVQHVIHPGNVKHINARYIVEGANNPTTLEAYTLTHQRGIQHLPDFIANAGGVIAAFVELTSNIDNEENARTRAKVHEAKATTQTTIRDNVRRMTACAEQYQVSLRDAGLLQALEAVFKHERC